MKIDFKKVYEEADNNKPAISRFLRDMIAIPSESRQEAKVIERIKAEMETIGFDRVDIDPMGNILGYIGSGRHLIAMDAHVDTVGVGDPDLSPAAVDDVHVRLQILPRVGLVVLTVIFVLMMIAVRGV